MASQVINISDAAATAQANALAPLCNSGTIAIYSGTQPINANAALSGNVLLATLTFGSTAFGAASAGAITANPITPGTAVATGTASFARIYKSDGVTVLGDLQVGTAGAGLNLNTTAIVSGVVVSCNSFVWTVSET